MYFSQHIYLQQRKLLFNHACDRSFTNSEGKMTNHLEHKDDKVCAAAACKSTVKFFNDYLVGTGVVNYICHNSGLNPLFYPNIDQITLGDTLWCLGMGSNTEMDNNTYSNKVSGANSSNILTPLE